MTGHINPNPGEEPGQPDVFRVRKPSRDVQTQFCLASLAAGQVSGLVPQGHATGAVMFGAAVLVLGRHCIHRS
ncbi:hypothetical protein [Streptomyces sp. NPDC005732]|uniref:hypothetical protein n=1 Tax=Streptomyces sp. NPDC005732 TaxID=3157057 RepID=UPI003403195B